MQNNYFIALETLSSGQRIPLNEVVEKLAFNDQGLIPVITQDALSKQVLMMAWMNLEALKKTLDTGRITYWSRSRNAFWIKGESSGYTQELVNMSFDCDGDVVLCQVNQIGPACHTGRPNCFYLKVDSENNQIEIVGDHA